MQKINYIDKNIKTKQSQIKKNYLIFYRRKNQTTTWTRMANRAFNQLPCGWH